MILQALALADLKAGKPSMGQFISLAWSILNIAHTFVDVNFSFEMSHNLRALHPAWFGFIAPSKQNAMGVALGLFSLGFVC